MRPAPVDRLVAELGALGLRPGDAVMVHASLRAVGPVESGADGLIDALDRVVAPGGAALMVLGAEDRHGWVNRRPVREREALLVDAEPFDATRTPADPSVGVLAERFRRRPGTRVTDHPEGRFGARGALARALLDDPPWDDYHGPGSALERLVALGGKVLRLGAGLDTVTLLHYAEYLARLPVKRRVVRHRRVLTAAGPAVRAVRCLDDENGVVDRPGEDYFASLTRAYLAGGRARVGPVGCARAELIDARELVAFAVRWMERELRPAGRCTRPAPVAGRVRGDRPPPTSTPMSDDDTTSSDTEALHALKIAFTYMPQLNDVNEYDFPGRVERVRSDVETVREALVLAGVDPDEVADELDPDGGSPSSY